MLDSEHPNEHQIATIDDFTVMRIKRLWENWLRRHPSETHSKHEFHRSVVCRESGLEQIRLATVYVLLARLEADLRDQFDAQRYRFQRKSAECCPS